VLCCLSAAIPAPGAWADSAGAAPAAIPTSAAGPACPGDDAGLTLPAGFCARVFADGIGHARHLAVAADGTVYVNTWSGRYYGNDTPHEGGFLVMLQDTTGAGTADVIRRFGATVQTGGAGGTGIFLYHDFLYAEINDKIVKYAVNAGAVPGAAQVVLRGLPLTGDHPMHPFAIDARGNLFVDVASATNACQQKNRAAESPGIDPCVELKTRGGVWRYDANKTGQTFSPAKRYATGIRNAEGFALDTAGHRIFVTQHGRDQLHANWPNIIKSADKEATLPSEELLRLERGGDYGWPECYFDPGPAKLVLAPEYGGDGVKAGICARKIAPIAAFPAHWAPNGMVFYDNAQFPARYRGGVFIAFHGSWDRAPYAQGGYNVVYQKLNGAAAGQCEIFADGFAGSDKSPGKAAHRPSGLGVGPDGSLFVSDDVTGRIYRISYVGGSGGGMPVPCPDLNASPGPVLAAQAKPPEGTHPDAGAGALPPGASASLVVLGKRVYEGEVGGAACTGCHGANGEGSPLGPNLARGTWLWSDGSYAAIAATITQGVAAPKQYRAPMPAMGGADLSPEQVNAVAAYVWTLSHH
jgi:glucose/arabinose dehydrogenase/mono/diheme cytochrome c family protein